MSNETKTKKTYAVIRTVYLAVEAESEKEAERKLFGLCSDDGEIHIVHPDVYDLEEWGRPWDETSLTEATSEEGHIVCLTDVWADAEEVAS